MTESDKLRRFEALALPHLDAAYNLARWLTRREQEADDIVQTAYLRAFRFFDKFEGSNARAWLLTIVHHTYCSWLRDNRHERGHLSFDEQAYDSSDAPVDGPFYANGADADPEALAIRADAGRIVNQALQALAPVYREALVLKEIDGLSYREIAEILDVPIGTVMSRLARGRALLARTLMGTAEDARDGMW